jgi:hypothetical protein
LIAGYWQPAPTSATDEIFAGDFRLYSSSALTDFCDTSAYQPLYRDIVLTPRCHDDPNKPNTYGACDVGAYESDDIFGNGFE